jgi:hypothetical protein
MNEVTRPSLSSEWITTRPPAATKIMGLTKHGILVIGHITRHEWDVGFIICWHKLPKKPANWDDILIQREAESCQIEKQ